ncbi:MAG: hypothetical protein AAFP04_02270 [Myxococcota bacterium]
MSWCFRPRMMTAGLLAILASFATNSAFAAESELEERVEDEGPPIFQHPWLLRTYGGYGLAANAPTREDSGQGFVGGVQLMLPANASQSYGVEGAFLQLDDDEDSRFVVAGLFVENRALGWLLTSIGGAGYFPAGDERPVAFGISTKIGWAPNYGIVSPFVYFKSDFIFAEETRRFTGLATGLAFALGG